MIQRVALDAMAREARASADGRETGGILLGHEDPLGIRVCHAGDPGPRAERNPRAFRRDLDHAQRLALSAFAEDESQWVGEWHTHVTGGGRPSRVDLASYHRHLMDAVLGFEHFVAVIITPPWAARVFGLGSGWERVTLHAWVVTKRGAWPVRPTVTGASSPTRGDGDAGEAM